MTESQATAASSGDVALHNTLDVTAVVPEWSVSEYRSCYRRLLDARRFAVFFSDGRSKAMIDRRGARHELDTGAGIVVGIRCCSGAQV